MGVWWESGLEAGSVSIELREAGTESSELHPPLVARVQQAHESIVRLVTELQAAGDTGRIRDILRDLSEIFPGHFADEEEPGGLFDQLRMQRPRYHSRLKSLQEEHRSILEELRGLQARARHLGGDVTQRGNEIARFARRLRAHERHENLLVLDVYMEDEGGSG